MELLAATDVTAPLLGPNGASRLFGPQKGADRRPWKSWKQALAYFAEGRRPEFIRVPGAGAAGGFGYGLAVLAGANIVSGYGLVAQALHLERRVAVADVVLTGEGRFDRQTALGKGPSALARSGKELGKPVVLFAGSVVREEGLDTSMFQEVIDVGNPALDKQAAVQALREAAARWATTARNMKPHDARDRSGRAGTNNGLGRHRCDSARAGFVPAHGSKGSEVRTTRIPAFWSSRMVASATRGKSSEGGSGSSGGAGTGLIASSRMKIGPSSRAPSSRCARAIHQRGQHAVGLGLPEDVDAIKGHEVIEQARVELATFWPRTSVTSGDEDGVVLREGVLALELEPGGRVPHERVEEAGLVHRGHERVAQAAEQRVERPDGEDVLAAGLQPLAVGEALLRVAGGPPASRPGCPRR